MVYNRLVALRQRVNQAFADIDVQLKQRHDLDPQPGRDGEGLRRPRARHARGRGQGAQRGDRPRRDRRQQAAGREHADRRAAPALRPVARPIRTSRPTRTSCSCRASSPTSRTRSPPPAASSTTRSRNTTPRSSSSRPCCSPALGFTPAATSSTSARAAHELEQAPQVKF